MALSKVRLFLSVLVCALFLSSYQVHCNESEDAFVNGINSYRKSINLSVLNKHVKASCLADKIADHLEKKFCNCTGVADFSAALDTAGAVAKFVNFRKLIKKCGIDAHTTTDGAILPACVPELIENSIVGKNNHSKYGKFFGDKGYSGIGIGSEYNWIVVVLTTEKADGSFSSAAPGDVAAAARGLAGLALGLLVFLVTQYSLL